MLNALKSRNTVKPLKSILLVEDDKDDQVFFIEALSKIKKATLYDVANNGKEALEKLKDRDTLPDFIFMDINMPLMNGVECLAAILKNPRTRNISVIILATDTWHTDLLSRLGAKAILKKPIEMKTLQWMLERIINSEFIHNTDTLRRPLPSESITY